MIQLTIKQALFDDVEGYTDDHVLYIVREGETVFYVGHSVDPLTRLEQHIQVDYIGEMVRTFSPHSLAWQFDMLTFADCAHMIDTANLNPTNRQHRELVERALITRYRPCCNKSGNASPSPLPEKYRSIHRLEAGETDNLY